MNRAELLNGKCTMPRIKGMKSVNAQAYTEIQNMWNAMWHAYLQKGNKGTISLPYWAQRIQHPKLMNIALKMLSNKGYIIASMQPHRNWSEVRINEDKLLTLVSAEELASIRKHYKWSHYLLTYTNSINIDKWAKATRINGTVRDTGHNMRGFAKASQTIFEFDTTTMAKYYDSVVKLVNYGIEKTLQHYPKLRKDMANYSEIGKEIVDTYINCPNIYNAGYRYNDSRGRDISGMLNKIGNPIGFKIMRSLLIIPEDKRQKATRKGLLAKYLFIAELMGYKSGTVFGKIRHGIKCYQIKAFHDIDISTDEGLKELPENIWLERLYADIDAYYINPSYKWIVPIELDMSASVLGFYGLVLGHEPYLRRTNMLSTDGKLNDAWGHSTITNRVQFKTIMRQLYGSQATPQDMWKDMKIPYTEEEAKAFAHELTVGEMSIANKFKDFLINNAQMQPTMKLNVWGQEFEVECNKFFNRGERTIRYDLYNSSDNSIKRIQHTDTIHVPDLNSFRRYVATALIHHLDARVMNSVCDTVYDRYEWIIPIHDAAIVDAEVANLVRTTYANELERVYSDRKQIVQEYARSINIPASAIAEWKKLQEHIVPVRNFKCSKMVLK